jgi:hypothetical protein
MEHPSKIFHYLIGNLGNLGAILAELGQLGIYIAVANQNGASWEFVVWKTLFEPITESAFTDSSVSSSLLGLTVATFVRL